MDRSIFIRSGSTNACYCGKCGQRQLGDLYNMRKHAQVCGSGVGGEDDVLLVDEDRGWGYYLDSALEDARPGVLTLRVCAPHLKVIRGFKDRFSGVEWTPIFAAEFRAGSKCPQIVQNETGYEMDTLMSLIRAGRIIPIRMERDVEVIRRVFPCIDIYSLQMFVHIYKNKGYSAADRIRPATEKWLFENAPGGKEWKKIGAVQAGGANGMAQAGRTNGMDQAGGANGAEQASAAVEQDDMVPILAGLYKMRGDRYILQVAIWKSERPTVFLFSKGYCSCSEEVDLRELLGQQFYLTGDSMTAIRKFDKAYPEYHLAQYAERSYNILVPLLAGDFHAGMELAAKAGAVGVAEAYDRLTAFENAPRLYRNLRDMFGVPISVLRALNREQVCDAVLERFRQIYEYAPAFLQFDHYTDSMMEFYMRADITHAEAREAGARGGAAGAAGAGGVTRGGAAGARGRAAGTRSGAARGGAAGVRGGARAAAAGPARGVEGIAALNDKQILQILRYLEKHPGEGHYYCDYMSACAQLGEYVFGITPNIPIREAHDRAVERIRNQHDVKTQRSFEQIVGGADYLRLATIWTDRDKQIFDKDPFIVIAPEHSDDLFRESKDMHNCVKIYVRKVIDETSRIYFLRRKKDPEKCLGTLEVSGNGRRLIQAKAFANQKLGKKEQIFLLKWCKVKGISIGTIDLTQWQKVMQDAAFNAAIEAALREEQPA